MPIARKLLDGKRGMRPAPLQRIEKCDQGIVGWVRSYVRSHEEREILFDLENTIASLREAKAERAIMDRLFKVRANLIRKWAED